MSGDFIDTQQTRGLQSDPKVIRDNWQKLEALGAYNIVKAVDLAGVPQARLLVRGYVTVLAALSGLTPAQMRDTLGLRHGDLSGGVAIYQLTRVPRPGEFEVRGYTTLVDGMRLKDGLDQDSHGYRPGHGAYQISLKIDIVAVLFATVRPDQRFQPPVHPKYRTI